MWSLVTMMKYTQFSPKFSQLCHSSALDALCPSLIMLICRCWIFLEYMFCNLLNLHTTPTPNPTPSIPITYKQILYNKQISKKLHQAIQCCTKEQCYYSFRHHLLRLHPSLILSPTSWLPFLSQPLTSAASFTKVLSVNTMKCVIVQLHIYVSFSISPPSQLKWICELVLFFFFFSFHQTQY